MTIVKAAKLRGLVGDGKEVVCKERGDVCMQNKVTNETLLLMNFFIHLPFIKFYQHWYFCT